MSHQLRLMIALLTIVVLLVAGCAKPQPAPVIAPPAAYLTLPPMPRVPDEPVTNLELVHYLFDLHDNVRECRAQVSAIADWANRQRGEYAR